MKLTENFSLQEINAFKLPVLAKYFFTVNSITDLLELAKNKILTKNKIYVLGEGTNTLFTKNFAGLILKIQIKGIKIIAEDKDFVIVEAGAGENWNDLVNFALKRNLGGIENLSYIPGTVGAAPIQNIAAYGQNFGSIFDSLSAFEIKTAKILYFRAKESQFGYRTSIFKNKLKNQFIIISVRLKLTKKPKFNLEYHSRYGSIIEKLNSLNIKKPYSIQDIAKAVIAIRKSKFPDWKKIGTAGSFFLNPVITKQKLAEIQVKFPDIQYYPVDELSYPQPNDPKFKYQDSVKVAAGWLLEELGWKGKRIGKVGTSSNQSLVIINWGNASPQEILDFSKKMQLAIYKNFKIKLEPEVNII